MAPDMRCSVCAAPGLLCARCKAVAYCGKEHQLQEWPQHKALCRNPTFEVRHNQLLGRHLVALRRIREGELVIREEPLAVGPSCDGEEIFARGKGALCCVSCCRKLAEEPGSWARCGHCGCPVCGPACQDNPRHGPECALLRRTRAAFSLFKRSATLENEMTGYATTILALRCLLAKENIANKISKLQSDSSKALFSGSWMVASKLLGADSPFTEQAFYKAVGTDIVNSFSLSGDDEQVKLTGLYFTPSMMSHSCVPNVAFGLMNEDKFEIAVWAVKNIEPGDVIETTYVSLYQTPQGRMGRLQLSKGFVCSCKRCSDPTDLGAYTGSLCCRRCKGKGKLGLLVGLPSSVSGRGNWTCETCGAREDDLQILLYLQEAESMMFGDGQYRSWSKHEVLQALLFPKGRMHPRSGQVLRVKTSIVSSTVEPLYLGQDEPRPTDAALTEAVQLAGEVLERYKAFQPQLMEGTGQLHLYKAMAMMELLRRRLSRSDQQDARAGLREEMRAVESEVERAEKSFKYICSYKSPLQRIRSKLLKAKQVLEAE